MLKKLFLSGVIMAQFALVAPALAINTTTGLGDAGFQGGYSTTQTLGTFIGVLLNAVLGVLGILLLCLIFYAGFMWMTAAGDEKKIKKAKDILGAAVVGIVIIISAWSISNFVISALQRTTTAETVGG